MNPTNSLVIETHDLSRSYKGVQALKSLNLAVKQHSIFGFLGPNGAGKTTTIKLLLGLARPSSSPRWQLPWSWGCLCRPSRPSSAQPF